MSFNFFNTIPAHDKKITLSTLFTLLRIVLIPGIVANMVAQRWNIAFMLFIVAAISDGIDGSLARWRNERTFIGACLDALADKLLIVSCFATLAFVQSPLFTIPQWFVLLVLVKELILIVGALYVYVRNGALKVNPTWLGKSTMVVQVCFIIWLFSCYFFHWLPIKTYWAMLGLLMILVLASLVQYTKIGINYLVGN